MSTIQWNVTVSGTPEIIRHCKNCGNKQIFISSGLFRINAQQNKLDIWLIYRCQQCDTSWNMTIHSRVASRSLNRAMYDGYLSNDPELARQCAFNRQLLRQNRGEACYGKLALRVEGADINLEALFQPISISLYCFYELDIRVEKLLRDKLNLSRAALKERIQTGKIYSSERNLLKAKFQTGMAITLSP